MIAARIVWLEGVAVPPNLPTKSFHTKIRTESFAFKPIYWPLAPTARGRTRIQRKLSLFTCVTANAALVSGVWSP